MSDIGKTALVGGLAGAGLGLLASVYFGFSIPGKIKSAQLTIKHAGEVQGKFMQSLTRLAGRMQYFGAASSALWIVAAPIVGFQRGAQLGALAGALGGRDDSSSHAGVHRRTFDFGADRG